MIMYYVKNYFLLALCVSMIITCNSATGKEPLKIAQDIEALSTPIQKSIMSPSSIMDNLSLQDRTIQDKIGRNCDQVPENVSGEWIANIYTVLEVDKSSTPYRYDLNFLQPECKLNIDTNGDAWISIIAPSVLDPSLAYEGSAGARLQFEGSDGQNLVWQWDSFEYAGSSLTLWPKIGRLRLQSYINIYDSIISHPECIPQQESLYWETNSFRPRDFMDVLIGIVENSNGEELFRISLTSFNDKLNVIALNESFLFDEVGSSNPPVLYNTYPYSNHSQPLLVFNDSQGLEHVYRLMVQGDFEQRIVHFQGTTLILDNIGLFWDGRDYHRNWINLYRPDDKGRLEYVSNEYPEFFSANADMDENGILGYWYNRSYNELPSNIEGDEDGKEIAINNCFLWLKDEMLAGRFIGRTKEDIYVYIKQKYYESLPELNTAALTEHLLSNATDVCN